MFSGGLDGNILVWDAKVPADAKPGVEKGPIMTLKGHAKDKKIVGLSFSSTTNELWSGCEDGTVRIWNLQVFQNQKISKSKDLNVVKRMVKVQSF